MLRRTSACAKGLALKSLINIQPSQTAQLDDASLPRIDFLQTLERLIYGQYFGRPLLGERESFVERFLSLLSSPFCRR